MSARRSRHDGPGSARTRSFLFKPHRPAERQGPLAFDRPRAHAADRKPAALNDLYEDDDPAESTFGVGQCDPELVGPDQDARHTGSASSDLTCLEPRGGRVDDMDRAVQAAAPILREAHRERERTGSCQDVDFEPWGVDDSRRWAKVRSPRPEVVGRLLPPSEVACAGHDRCATDAVAAALSAAPKAPGFLGTGCSRVGRSSPTCWSEARTESTLAQARPQP